MSSSRPEPAGVSSLKDPSRIPRLGTMKAFDRLIGGVLPATTSIFTRRTTLLLLFMGAGLTLVQPCAGAAFQWEQTGSLAIKRNSHTATLLPNGKVLAAGGSDNGTNLASAALYDPVIATWTSTASLMHPHSHH